MRITSWNVNGLRSVLEKRALDWVKDLQPDILCLQEIKTRPDQIDYAKLVDGNPLDGFEVDWNPAERPGYSGVATFFQRRPLETQRGIGSIDFDREGRVNIAHYPSFWLLNVYFPNGQRDHGRVPFKLAFYAELLAWCQAKMATGEGIIVCGDFNTAHQEIDLRHPKQNQNTTGFLPEERAWVDRYLSSRLVDIYRQRYPERVQYTWWTYRMGARQRNIGWRLDYFLISDNLVDRVTEVEIHDSILGSDHCPVSLCIME